jgi:hypothetical protein
MQSTKKLPLGVNPKTRKSGRGGFLVPASTAEPEPRFLCIKTGKTYADGVLVYIGASVPSEEILARASLLPEQVRAHLSVPLLDDFLGQIQQFKIGDVVRLRRGDDGRLVMEKSSLKLSLFKAPILP